MEPIFKLEDIPSDFADNEIILKGVYNPMNFNKSGVVKKNVFMPPAGSNEISVLRLKYSSAKRCKFHCKKIQTSPGRNFWGFARILKNEVYSVNNCTLVHTSQKYEEYELPEHADLILPFTRPSVANDPLPIDDDIIVEQLFSLASTHQDPDIESDDWQGDSLI